MDPDTEIFFNGILPLWATAIYSIQVTTLRYGRGRIPGGLTDVDRCVTPLPHALRGLRGCKK